MHSARSWLLLALLAAPFAAGGNAPVNKGSVNKASAEEDDEADDEEQNEARPVTQSSVDLDGDGKPEKVALQPGAEGAFTLSAGSVRLREKAEDKEVRGFTVEDLDASDKQREVFVHTSGLHDDVLVLIYAFDGKRFIELGRFPSSVEVRGNGIVLISTHMGFWSRVDKYVLDRKQNRFSQVEQDVYWVNVKAPVLQTFPLQRSRTDATVIANVAPNTRILLVASAPERGEEGNDWYLIKTSTGLMGWARLQSFSSKVKLLWVG